jgi:hypothetical protein
MDGPCLSPELVPSPPRPSHVHPRRPCHSKHAFLHSHPATVATRAPTWTSATTGARGRGQGWSCRSALGPYRIGHVWIPAGASGDDEYQGTAGHRTCMPRTSPAGARRKRLRIHLRAAAGRRPLLTRQVVTEDGPRPARKLMPAPTGPNHVSSSPAVPLSCHTGRVTLVSSGQPRSPSLHR